MSTPERPTSSSSAASKRRRSLRIADTLVVVGLLVSYFTSSSVALHAIVSLLWSASVGWHFWMHRKWFKSVKRRLSRSRTLWSRGSALTTVAIAGELTAVVVFGIIAWLGPRGLKGVHGSLGSILLGVAAAHVVFNFRQLKALVRRRTTTIDRRFRGSAESAQRGFAAGKAASHAEGTLKVEFRGAPPVEEELLVEVDSEEHVTVFHGSDVVMEATPEPALSFDIPASVEVMDEIFARGQMVVDRSPDRPHCFGCSLEREDGLGIVTAPVDDTGIWGTMWVPDASLPSSGDFVDDEVLWAALDCPGSFVASDPTRQLPGVTGSPSLDAITVQIRDRVRIGEELVVMGWTLDRTEDLVECGTAIVDRAGHVKAFARLRQSISEDHPPHGQ